MTWKAPIREASEGEVIEKAQFVYRNIFMAMEHNYYCAVCRQSPAVIETWWGVLQPCWACQKLGYTKLEKKKPSLFKRAAIYLGWVR